MSTEYWIVVLVFAAALVLVIALAAILVVGLCKRRRSDRLTNQP